MAAGTSASIREGIPHMTSVSCLLACGCWVEKRLRAVREWPKGTCSVHGEQTVTRVNTHVWRVRCHPPCRFGRWLGQDESEARRLQRRHRGSHPTHTPEVAYDQVTEDGRGTLLVWDGLYAPRRPRFQSWAVQNPS